MYATTIVLRELLLISFCNAGAVLNVGSPKKWRRRGVLSVPDGVIVVSVVAFRL